MAEKFTQGEWRATRMVGNKASFLIGVNGKQVCGIWKGRTSSPEISEQEAEANARLIAQAPALCEALLHIYEMTHDREIEKYIEAVLAKVEGNE